MDKKVERLITICSNERIKNACFELMTKALHEEGLCVGNKNYKTMITPATETIAMVTLIATNNEWEAEFRIDVEKCSIGLLAING